MSIEARLHSMGFPLRIVSIKVSEKAANVAYYWIGESPYRVLHIKDYSQKTEELMVAVGQEALKKGRKCLFCIEPPDNVEGGSIYIIPVYTKEFEKALKKIVVMAYAMVVYEHDLPINKGFILEV
jgi:hypothetical protein